MRIDITRHAPHGVDCISVDIIGDNDIVIGGLDMVADIDKAGIDRGLDMLATRFPAIDLSEVRDRLHG